jgi:hypothetical protein
MVARSQNRFMRFPNWIPVALLAGLTGTLAGLGQTQKRAVMFPEKPPEKQNNAAVRFSGLKSAKTKLLDGDYDVFGDGTVVLLLIPGHQCLYVKLAKTGGVVSRPNKPASPLETPR